MKEKRVGIIELVIFLGITGFFLYFQVPFEKEIIKNILQISGIIFSFILLTSTLIFRNINDYISSRMMYISSLKNEEDKKAARKTAKLVLTNKFDENLNIVILVALNLVLTFSLSFFSLTWDYLLQGVVLNFFSHISSLDSLINYLILSSFILMIFNIFRFIFVIISISKDFIDKF